MLDGTHGTDPMELLGVLGGEMGLENIQKPEKEQESKYLRFYKYNNLNTGKCQLRENTKL